MEPSRAVGPSALWLPLLRSLTDALPGWGVWKNADAALEGDGDIDSAAPHAAWDDIVERTATWAHGASLGPVIECRHVDGVLFVVALDPDRPTFYELDVNARKYWRGATLFQAEDLLPLFHTDDRGFRRLRPGAEAVIVFTQNGTRWGGRPNPDGAPKVARVRQMLIDDPEGVALAARTFRIPVRALQAGIRAASDGGWDQRAMATIEAATIARALGSPGTIAGRWRARGVKRTCPLLRSIFSEHRVIPADRDAWLDRVASAHPAGAIRA